MKRFLLPAVLVAMVFSCHEPRENTTQKIPRLYDKRVGEQISFDVATRWAKSFNTVNMTGRTSSTYALDANALAQLINPVDERLGVVLHHGLDDSNQYRLMMYALDEDSKLFKNKILDLASGDIIDGTTAKEWAANYAAEHPATPWYHFFGSDVFAEIQSNDAFEYVDIVRGLNEESKEQVLLFVYNTKGVSGGRSEGADVTVYDVSQGCPPCAVN